MPANQHDDILTALFRMRLAFKQQGSEPPDCVLLKSPEDGLRFVSEMKASNGDILTFHLGEVGKPVEHPDGSVWMEVEVMGMKVRWPATKRPTHNGGFIWAEA